MIELKNVYFSYDNLPVLKDFSLTVNDGECVCITGPSGCGKTTVLKLILGLIKQDSGKIIAPKKISTVFQEDRLLSQFSLQKNIFLPLDQTQQKKALSLIEEADLGDFLNKKVRHFSGGMKRRAAIIRAVAFDGEALILDEPFNALDLENKQRMANIIKREFLDKGKPVLMVSHIADDTKLLNARTVEMNVL